MGRRLTLAATLLVAAAGCERMKRTVGLADTPRTAEDIQADLDRVKMEAEAKVEQARLEAAERSRLEQAKRADAEQSLRSADTLVSKWASRVGEAAGRADGFDRVEGFTDIDPWGNPITIEYTQDWFTEVATIRSNGPDGQPRTADDLVRSRRASNPAAVWSGMPPLAQLAAIWFGFGLLAIPLNQTMAVRRRHHGLVGRHEHPVLFAACLAMTGFVGFLVYAIQLFGNVLGVRGNFFDGFRFEYPD